MFKRWLFIFSLTLCFVNSQCSNDNAFNAAEADIELNQLHNESYAVLSSGSIDISTGEIEDIERSLDPYIDITNVIRPYFSFSVNQILPDNTYDITLRLINPTSITAYDVLIVFENLYGKTVINSDGSIDIFQPYDLDPFIAFRKEDTVRAFLNGVDTEQLLLKVPQFSNPRIDYFIVAHLDGNTGGVYSIGDFKQLNPLYISGTSEIEVKVSDYQDDVTMVAAKVSSITDDIVHFSPTSTSGTWRTTVNNTKNAQPGDYPIIVMATSPSSPSYNTYQSFTVAVDYDFTPIDNLLQNASFDSVLLLIKDGEIIYEKAFGNYTTDKRVQLVSGSKWITATLIMKLVDEGILDLDRTIASYLPDWGGILDPRKKDITLRQCLCHISGMTTSNSCLDNPDASMRDCAYSIGNSLLLATPGNRFIYGQASFQVAAYVAENQTGIPFPDLIQQKLIDPLGMESFSWAQDPSQYVRNPQVAAGGYCNARDYARMLQMLLDNGIYDGKTFMSPQAINELFTNQTDGVPIAFTPYIFTEYANREYNIGNWREQVNPQTDELWVAGCAGILGFSPWIDFRKNLVGVFLVESFFTTTFPVYLDLQDAIDQIISDE